MKKLKSRPPFLCVPLGRVALLRCAIILALLASYMGLASAAEVGSIDANNDEKLKEWTRRQENERLVGRERIRVKGFRTTPAELVSGSRADYLQKYIDLGPLGKVNPAQVAFSTMTTTHDAMMDQQLRTTYQALQYMPSVNLAGRGNGVFFPINRGYAADIEQNSRIDGLNALITTPYAAEQFDHITVVNGTASALYGPESPAGMVLQVQKRPTDKPFFNFNFGYDSNGSPLESMDTSVGKGPLKVRFNYLNQTGQSYTSNSNQHRNLYAGDIDLQLAKHTKLELDGSQYNSGIYGLPGIFSYNSAFDKKNPNVMLGLPDAPNVNHPGYGTNDGGLSATTSVGTMKLFHDFTKTLHLRLGGLYEDASRNSLLVNNQLLDSCAESGGPCYKQTMQAQAKANDFRTWSNFAYLNWEVTDPIFRIRHHLNVGSNGYSLNNFNPITASVGMTGLSNIGVGIGSLYDPWQGSNARGLNSNGNAFGSGQVAPGVYWNNLSPKGQGEYKSASTQVQDVMFGDIFDVGDYFTIMGQLAWGWIQGNSWNPSGKNVTPVINGKNALNSNGSFDPSVGITFHPTKRFSAYFNWGQDTGSGKAVAFVVNQPGACTTDPSVKVGQNCQTMTGPQRSTQFEGSLKYNWRDRFLVTLGGFGMSRPFTIGNAATRSNGGYAGDQNDMGMEFSVAGSLLPELSLYGGVTYDNAKYDCTASLSGQGKGSACQSLGFTNGNVSRVIGVAPWQSDFLLDWHPLWMHGFSFNSNIHYQGSRPSNASNISYVNDYVTLDLGMRYVTRLADHMVVLRGNIDNVTNQKYWGTITDDNQSGASKGGYSAEVGAPQTWHITASYYF